MKQRWLGMVLLCAMPLLAMAQAIEPAAVILGVMKAAEVQRVLPATVFFRGQSAAVQARNSGGIIFADKRMMLVGLVDTSGYSTQVQEKYQAYLLTEIPLEIGGRRLVPGGYGCGFIAGDKFIVQDIGAHDLLTTASTKDAGLKRPTPLQVLAGPNAGEFRLYAGRSFVTLRAAGQ